VFTHEHVYGVMVMNPDDECIVLNSGRISNLVTASFTERLFSDLKSKEVSQSSSTSTCESGSRQSKSVTFQLGCLLGLAPDSLQVP